MINSLGNSLKPFKGKAHEVSRVSLDHLFKTHKEIVDLGPRDL